MLASHFFRRTFGPGLSQGLALDIPVYWTLLGNEAQGSSRSQSHQHVGAAGRGVLAGSGLGKPCVLQGWGLAHASPPFPPPPPLPWLILHMCSARASNPQAIKHQSNPVPAESEDAAPKHGWRKCRQQGNGRPAVQKPAPHRTHRYPTLATMVQDWDQDRLLGLLVPQPHSWKWGAGSSEGDGEWL